MNDNPDILTIFIKVTKVLKTKHEKSKRKYEFRHIITTGCSFKSSKKPPALWNCFLLLHQISI